MWERGLRGFDIEHLSADSIFTAGKQALYSTLMLEPLSDFYKVNTAEFPALRGVPVWWRGHLPVCVTDQVGYSNPHPASPEQAGYAYNDETWVNNVLSAFLMNDLFIYETPSLAHCPDLYDFTSLTDELGSAVV